MDDIDSHKHVLFSNVSFLVKDFAFNSTFNRVWEFLHFSLRLTRKTEPFRRACAFTLKYSPDLLQVSTIIYYTTGPIHYQTNNGRMNERTIDRPTKQTTNRRQNHCHGLLGFTQVKCATQTQSLKKLGEEKETFRNGHWERENSLFISLMKTKQNMSTTTHRLTHSHLALCNSKLL